MLNVNTNSDLLNSAMQSGVNDTQKAFTFFGFFAA
jgi:hypothetical protein